MLGKSQLILTKNGKILLDARNFFIKKGVFDPKFGFFLQLEEHLETKYEVFEIILGFSENKILIEKVENIFLKNDELYIHKEL